MQKWIKENLDGMKDNIKMSIHIRPHYGYFDIHLPRKDYELFYFCLDWQLHKIKIAMGKSLSRWFICYYPYIRKPKWKPIKLKIVRGCKEKGLKENKLPDELVRF